MILANVMPIMGALLAGMVAALDLIASRNSACLYVPEIGGRKVTQRPVNTGIDPGTQFFIKRTKHFQSVVDQVMNQGAIKVRVNEFPLLKNREVIPRPECNPRCVCVVVMSDLAKVLLLVGAEELRNTEVTSAVPLLSGSVDGDRSEVLYDDSTVCLARDVVLNMLLVQLLTVASAVLGDIVIASFKCGHDGAILGNGWLSVTGHRVGCGCN